ncbi:MAG: PAS domain S-box-containing protein [Cyclobacteriaceae bacterium]|jgi:PAS domain S-box-containing protein
MKIPKTPKYEENRLSALIGYEILDTPSEKDFDDITELASSICNTPVALISFTDKNRQWFKSRVGLEATETPRNISFCAHAINKPNEILVVEDTQADDRFYDNPLLTEKTGIRFYAGVPIVDKEGHALGTLCLLDDKPRKLDKIQRQTLQVLSKQVMKQLELRKKLKETNEMSRSLQKEVIQRKESQQKLKSLIELYESTEVTAKIGSWEVDIKTNKTIWSKEVYRIHEVALGTPIDIKNATNFYHPDDQPIIEKALNRAINEKESYDLELKIITKKKNQLWVRASGEPVFENGKLVKLKGLFQDIDKPKRHTIELDARSQDLNSIIENTNDLIWSVDNNLKLITFNTCFKKSILKKTNKAPKEGENVINYVYSKPEKREWRQYYKRVLSKECFSLEIKGEMASPFSYGLISFNPILDNNGEVTGCSVFMRDITERKLRERALLASEEKYKSIFKNSLDIIGIINKEACIVDLNQVNVGFIKEDVIGSSLHDWTTGDKELVLSKRSVNKVFKQGLTTTYNIHFSNTKGGMIWYSVMLCPIFKDDKVISASLIGHDITTLKVKEQELRESDLRYQSMYHQTPAMMYSVDSNFKIISVSNYCLNKTGYKRHEILGKKYLDFLTDKSRSYIENTIQFVFEDTGKILNLPCQYLKKNGKPMDVLLSAISEKRKDGKIANSLIVITDVTKERKAEIILQQKSSELKLFNDKFKLIQKAAKYGIWDWDIKNNQLIWDDQMYKLHGVKNQNFNGVHEAWQQLLHPEDVANSFKELQKALHGKKELNTRHRVVHSSGEVRDLKAVARVFRNERNEPIRMLGANWDITEELTVKNELKVSKERFELAVAGTNDGIWDWPDINDERVWWSNNFYKLLGYKNGEIKSNWSSFKELLHPHDHKITSKRIREHLNKDIPFNTEYRLRNKSGAYRWFRAQATLVKHSSQKTGRMVGSISDIHNEKLDKDKLARLNELLQTTQKTAHIGSWELDVEKKEVFWTPEVYHIHQLSVGTPIKLEDAINFYHPDYKAEVADTVEQAFEKKKSWDRQWKIITGKNKTLWVRVVGKPIVENGKTIKLQGVFMDINKMKSVEQRISQLNHSLEEKVLKRTKDLQQANEKLIEQTQELKTSEEELQSQHEEILKSNKMLEENRIKLEGRNNLILRNNKTLERVHEELEIKAEELTLSSQYKSEFLSNMSHELRTPLNSILILSKLLKTNTAKNLNSDQVKSASIIHSSGHGLLELIDEILDLSKIEAGKMEIEKETVALNQLIGRIKSIFKPVTDDKGLKFDQKTEKKLPTNIFTDRMRLEQILKNLLSNAIKFTNQGKITLHVFTPSNKTKYHNPGLKDQKVIGFTVSDTGIGIPEDKQELVFEAFQQADGSVQRKFGGTGLGLAISNKIARLLGGEITVTSEYGIGSSFTLYMPIKDSQKSPLQVEQISNQKVLIAPNENVIVPAEIPDDRSDIKINEVVILIVEDDPFFARMLLKMTRENGYKAVVLGRGDQVIEFALNIRPIGIILDIELPMMDGYQVLENLKNTPEIRHIPVYMISAMERNHRALHEGAVDFIQKPFGKSKMIDIFGKMENVVAKKIKQVLIIGESKTQRTALQTYFADIGIECKAAGLEPKTFKLIESSTFDCLIIDVTANSEAAIHFLENFKKEPKNERLPVIVYTGMSVSSKLEQKVAKYANAIIVKTADTYQRLMDELTLFLHFNPLEHQQSFEEKKKMLKVDKILSNKRALIIEDDIRSLYALTNVLESHGMEVISAENGLEAMELVEKNQNLDVILCDLVMPKMDGYQTIIELRKIVRLKKVPIICVSAKVLPEERKRCLELGASDYLSKPIDPNQLISLLRIWLY